MKDEIIKFETAKLAKKKGFVNGSKYVYHEIGKYTMTSDSFFRDGGATMLTNRNHLEAPTQSLLQKWLREKHKLLVYPDHMEAWWKWVILTETNWTEAKYVQDVHPSYEESLELGLIEALNMIP